MQTKYPMIETEYKQQSSSKKINKKNIKNEV